jgi:hypothetical protein
MEFMYRKGQTVRIRTTVTLDMLAQIGLGSEANLIGAYGTISNQFTNDGWYASRDYDNQPSYRVDTPKHPSYTYPESFLEAVSSIPDEPGFKFRIGDRVRIRTNVDMEKINIPGYTYLRGNKFH